MSAITDLFAGVAVSDLDVSNDWYTRFFGRPPDHRIGDENLWEIDEHATLFIEPNAAQAGSGRINWAGESSIHGTGAGRLFLRRQWLSGTSGTVRPCADRSRSDGRSAARGGVR